MNISLDGFLREFINRLGGKSPKFFVIIKWLGIACAVITGLPGFLVQVGIDLPPDVLVLQDKVVAWAASIGAFIASLTVANATTITNETNALPFTENNPVSKAASVAAVKKNPSGPRK